MCKKVATAIVITTFLVFISCAGTQVPLSSAADILRSTTEGNLQHKYVVTFKDGSTYQLNDEDIDVCGDTIGIRFEGQEGYSYYRADQFQEIRYKTKKHTWLGAGIGAGVGGVGTGLAFGLGAKCEGTGGAKCEEKALHALGIVGFGLLGAGVGFGIGAGIGSAFPKKKKHTTINVSPQVYQRDGYKVTGGGLGINGSF